MKKHERKQRTQTDERVIAPMNVEGMPWYREDAAKRDGNAPQPEKMTLRQTIRYAFSAVGAGLLIVAAFGIGGWLFIQFCIHVWLK